jgi:hypothetical protein
MISFLYHLPQHYWLEGHNIMYLQVEKKLIALWSCKDNPEQQLM